MSTPIIGANAIGFEHRVAAGQAVTGVLSADAGTMLSARDVFQFAENAAAGEGLFDPHIIAAQNHPYCTFVQIMCDAGLAWTINVTSGLEDGTAGPGNTVDNPVYDQEIASGTGPVHQRMNIELLPKQKIRVTVAASATNVTRVIAHFASVLNAGGRLIS